MKIQILGATASGKSTITNLINDLLTSHGFNVKLVNEETMGDYTPNLRSLREQGLDIEIETIELKTK